MREYRYSWLQRDGTTCVKPIATALLCGPACAIWHSWWVVGRIETPPTSPPATCCGNSVLMPPLLQAVVDRGVSRSMAYAVGEPQRLERFWGYGFWSFCMRLASQVYQSRAPRHAMGGHETPQLLSFSKDTQPFWPVPRAARPHHVRQDGSPPGHFFL